MMRLLLLPLFLFTLSMACMGQTFQYSRGWTNGKRALSPPPGLSNAHFHRGDDSLADLYDFQDNERKLERCLVQLHRFVGSALLHRSYGIPLGYNANQPDASNNGHASANNNNNDNSLYANANHHQSSEMFEELNAAAAAAAAAGGTSAEPNDYGKH